MTTLADHQFEILPSEEAADGFVFGIGAEVSVTDGGFDPGDIETLNQDGQNTRRGVLGFGRDVRGAKAWVWESHTDMETEEDAADVLDRFSAAWAAEELSRQPGAQTCLRYRMAGRNRRIFGRPRRYAAPPTNLIMSGYVPVTHDFQCVDSYTYDDVESQVNIPYASGATGGGFILPATLPINSLPSDGNGADQITVTGTSRAYPIIRFNGPWINPGIATDDWVLSWTGSIAAGSWVEIDTRPWRLTVLNQSGASVVEGLSRRTWLEDVWFAPDSQPQISLIGAATGGGSSCLVRWRNTWTSI